MMVWRKRVAVILLASLLSTLVVASPAWAEDTSDTYQGGPTDVGVRATKGAADVPWDDNVGETSGAVGLEIKRRWFDVWAPIHFTQFGVAWQCVGSATSTSWLHWFADNSDFTWGSLVDAGPGSAGSFPLTCNAGLGGEHIEWVGVTRRTRFALTDYEETYEVLIGTGSRGVCALPGGSSASRICADATGAENSAWIASVGVNAQGQDVVRVGADWSQCDYGSSGATTGTERVAPAMYVLDVASVAYGGAGSGGPWNPPGSLFSSQGLAPQINGSTDQRHAAPPWLGWSGIWNPSGVVDVQVEAGSGTLFPLVGSGAPASGVTASRSTGAPLATNTQWTVNAGSLTVAHTVRIYCLRNVTASTVITPGSGAVPGGDSCAKVAVTAFTFTSFAVSWWAPTGCWELVGQANFFFGDTGIGDAGPEGSGETAGCVGIDFGCILDGLDEFVDSLTDLPATLFELLTRLFVPSQQTMDRALALRDAVMIRPPWSVAQVALSVGQQVVDGLTGSSCVRPTIDLGGLKPGLVGQVPSRCGGFSDTAMFEASYQIVRLAIYGALVWSLWGIARNGVES